MSPVVRVADVDEDALLADSRADGDSPAEQVLALARAKAQKIADSIESSGEFAGSGHAVLVVGCDSMLEFHGEVLGKPHDADVALERVMALSGDSGVLHTGHWVVLVNEDASDDDVVQAGGTESTVVKFAAFSEAEARAYVATGEPLEVAGSFTIDGLGGAFIRGVEGDPHNVIGISLPLLRHLFGHMGVFWPSLWAKPQS